MGIHMRAPPPLLPYFCIRNVRWSPGCRCVCAALLTVAPPIEDDELDKQIYFFASLCPPFKTTTSFPQHSHNLCVIDQFFSFISMSWEAFCNFFIASMLLSSMMPLILFVEAAQVPLTTTENWYAKLVNISQGDEVLFAAGKYK